MQETVITLHHLPNSRSQRILWLLEELNADYDLIIHRDKQAADARHENMKFPTLQLDQNGHTQRLTESSAIAEYLCQKYQRLMLSPTDIQYWNYCFYKNFADAAFMPNLVLKQIFSHIVQQTPWLLRIVSVTFKNTFNRAYLNPELNRQLQQLNLHLQHNDWLAGTKFSMADILLWFPLQASQYAHSGFISYPSPIQYLARIKSRPAFQTALEKGEWSAPEFERYWQITR